MVLARTDASGKAKIEPFMTGLLDEKKNEFPGRPVYLLQMKDGSLLVSDELNGADLPHLVRPTKSLRRQVIDA